MWFYCSCPYSFRTESSLFSPVYTITTDSSSTVLPNLTTWAETNVGLPSGHASLPNEDGSCCLVRDGVNGGGAKVEEVKISLSNDVEDERMTATQPCALTQPLAVTENGLMDP